MVRRRAVLCYHVKIGGDLLNFQFQDGSDGEVSLLLSCHPGLHDDGRESVVVIVTSRCQ